MAYNLRNSKRKNYKADVKLPRATRTTQATKVDELYPVEVIARDGDKVKIHYIGYGDEDDEWRDTAEIVETQPDVEPYVPFDVHRELGYQIALALNSKHRSEPEVRIELPFDKLLFEGGLKQYGKLLCKSRGHDVYTIERYSALIPLLGDKWHMRGLNERLNFCYVNLKTVQFHLHKRQNIEVFDSAGKRTIPGGYVLVFKFVRMDGVKQDWDSVARLT